MDKGVFVVVKVSLPLCYYAIISCLYSDLLSFGVIVELCMIKD